MHIRYTRETQEEEAIARQSRYRGFLLDADDTLFDFDRCESEAIYETLATIRKPTPVMIEIYRKINNHLWEKLDRSHDNSLDTNFESTLDSRLVSIESRQSDLKVERFRLLIQQLGIEADPEELSIRYLENLSQKHYLMPHAVSLLEFLSKRSLLCLVTNGLACVQKNRIARAELEFFFNEILISEEIGLVKPHPDFFLLAARRLHLSPHEVLCVGDDPLADIQGARSAGIDTCWYNPYAQSYPASCPPPDYTISDLMELKVFAAEVS